MSVMEAFHLTKKYNGTVALDNLNLSVSRGEIFCLLGQNGAGKTTTINLFLGFIEPSSGQAAIRGQEVGRQGESTRPYVAYIPEVVQLYGNLSGLENLDVFSRLAAYRYTRDELRDILVKAGLQSEVHDRRMSGYSKGMRQKVGIAIALAKNAELILMDEPTSGLDPKSTSEFTHTCKSLAAEGKTIFMATHDIFNAVNVGSKIGIMKQGKLVHTLHTKDVNAEQLQRIYLETI